MLSRSELVHRLSVPTSESSPRATLLPYTKGTPAAVLIPILNTSPDIDLPTWQVLFTRRTDQVADHKGQVSFPGGRQDPGDLTVEATALREAHEEIGLEPKDVEVIGKLPQFMTISRYTVTPVIGFIPHPYRFSLQPQEVSRVFTIPLSWLADPANHETRTREITLEDSFRLTLPVIYFKHYQNELLWGITAEITLRLLEKLSLVK